MVEIFGKYPQCAQDKLVVTRRQLMQSSATAVGGVTFLAAFSRAGEFRQATPNDTAVVLDRRFAESTLFARELGADSRQCYAIKTDVVDLWYDDLHALSADRSCAIVGLTRECDWFVLKQFGRVHQYAPIIEDHKGMKGGTGLVAWMLAPV